jgi:hypothetical protein
MATPASQTSRSGFQDLTQGPQFITLATPASQITRGGIIDLTQEHQLTTLATPASQATRGSTIDLTQELEPLATTTPTMQPGTKGHTPTSLSNSPDGAELIPRLTQSSDTRTTTIAFMLSRVAPIRLINNIATVPVHPYVTREHNPTTT